MRIFVGWPNDANWVDEYVLPVMKSYASHGLDVVTGKELCGQTLTDAVKQEIHEADAALFFSTRRERSSDGSWTTSDWVVDEIKHANSLRKDLIFEFREHGVEYPNKIHETRQHALFDPEDRLGCLREVAKIVNKWRGPNFRVRLAAKNGDQKAFAREASRRLRNREYQCRVSLRQAGRVILGPRATELHREGNEIVFYTGDLPAHLLTDGTVLEVHLEMGDEVWSVKQPSFTTLVVPLEKS